MTALYTTSLCWFRRDLRSHDHAALHQALTQSRSVHCVFVFDTGILDKLARKDDRRVEFIWHSIVELQESLEKMGGGLIVLHGNAEQEIPQLAHELGVNAVFVNHDYEANALTRDEYVAEELRQSGIDFHSSKDQVIFEKHEVLTQNNKPFTVFTPYKNAWLKRFTDDDMAPYEIEKYKKHFARPTQKGLPSLEQIGFEKTNIIKYIQSGASGAQGLLADFQKRMADYKDARDFPAVRGVSYLSVHLRFGTISIRELVRAARAKTNRGAECWLSELIWREFYFNILHHFPHVAERSFRPEYDLIQWENNQALFAAWCEGKTGYPLVDAAMRQINQTGYMHNRLRMIVASFLTKDLHIDWRWGENYFADNLNDFDLAANNGGWQWAASSGCDTQPYFRIFNPVTQSERFDAEGKFIRKYIPELTHCDNKRIHAPWLMTPLEQQAAGVVIGKDYPAPVVDHAVAREKTLRMYGAVKKT
ncbi:MAG: deoxyribodipyrimidine photo-lyase [Burkholderiales bacterium]